MRYSHGDSRDYFYRTFVALSRSRRTPRSVATSTLTRSVVRSQVHTIIHTYFHTLLPLDFPSTQQRRNSAALVRPRRMRHNAPLLLSAANSRERELGCACSDVLEGHICRVRWNIVTSLRILPPLSLRPILRTKFNQIFTLEICTGNLKKQRKIIL